MADLISVIVPVYNTAGYIAECIDSVLQQTYSCFELILIDDGSQDDSVKVCREMCERDDRLRLLSQEHKGVSAARNLGMKEARGGYLFFLDSDDAIHPRLLEALLGLMQKTGAEIGMEGYAISSSEEISEYFAHPDEVYDETRDCLFAKNEDLVKAFFSGSLRAEIYAIGGKMIRGPAARSLQFDEKMAHSEDTKFFYQLLKMGSAAAVLSKDWYYYRMHERSAIKKSSVKVFQDIYRCEKYICQEEAAQGRNDYAIGQERRLIDRILLWYRQSRKERNQEKCRYLRELAAAEGKCELFTRLSFFHRFKFWLAFQFYPLYLLIHVYWMKRKDRMEKERGQHG